jgi:hypothetical protein
MISCILEFVSNIARALERAWNVCANVVARPLDDTLVDISTDAVEVEEPFSAGADV